MIMAVSHDLGPMFSSLTVYIIMQLERMLVKPVGIMEVISNKRNIYEEVYFMFVEAIFMCILQSALM